MKLYHLLLVTILAAHAQSATLRQYSRDWLIAGETSLHKEPKRITAKSVFIAPDFSAVRCAQGYREDASGNCVKLVRVSQTAQLDFLLQKLNAMYGSGGTPGSFPFGGTKPVDGPSGVAPYDAPKPQGDKVDFENVKPPKAEPCIELPTPEDTSTTSTTQPTTVTTEATSLSSTETFSVSDNVQILASSSEMPASTDVTLAVTTESGLTKDPEVVLVGNDSDLVVSVVDGNGTSVLENEDIPVVHGSNVLSGVENASVDHLLFEVNDQGVGVTGDVVTVVKDDGNLISSTKFHEVETTTEGSVSETVPIDTMDKDLEVDVEEMTTETPESTTVVDEIEDTATEDYSDEFPIEPEMGSGERDKVEVENVSADNLFSETINANLDAMMEVNNSSQDDKVLPVRNIIPEASSERIQFIDSPIINIQPVRNTFPDGDEIMEVDLKPNANLNGASLQVHNLNPSKLVPPKFMEEPVKPIPDTPFSLDDYLNRQPVPPIPVYRPYENLNFNPQQQHFPLQYQQPPFPPRNGFVRFPEERDQVYQVDQRVNSVRFPPGESFNDEKLRQWPSNWRLDNRRVQRPVMRFWNKMPLIRNVEEANQRFQQDRRRPPPQYYQ